MSSRFDMLSYPQLQLHQYFFTLVDFSRRWLQLVQLLGFGFFCQVDVATSFMSQLFLSSAQFSFHVSPGHLEGTAQFFPLVENQFPNAFFCIRLHLVSIFLKPSHSISPQPVCAS